MIVTTQDFTGLYALPTDVYTIADLQAYIDELEESLIYELLGAELGALFIADLVAGVPVDPLFLLIFNPFQDDVKKPNLFYTGWGNLFFWEFYGCGCENKVMISKGIKFYLKVLIWFNYVRDNKAVAGIQSLSQRESANSTNANYNSHLIGKKYNDAIQTGKAIQWYILENKDDYPEFNGIRQHYMLNL